jgi:type VI secretion system protein ImpG
MLALGCTPIVNLFSKITDPLRLDYRKVEYHLVPDQRLDGTTEIYQIDKVLSAIDEQGDVKELPPYFSLNHNTGKQKDSSIYWHAKRVSAHMRDLPGSDMYISCVDLNFNPSLPPKHILYAHTVCTNRLIPPYIGAYTPLHSETPLPNITVQCMNAPTPPVHAELNGDTLWRLVSSLSTDYLTFSNTSEALACLKELLMLHTGSHQSQTLSDIDRIEKITTQPIVRRCGNEAWRGFIKGVEISLYMRHTQGESSGCFLLANVLRHFFAFTISANSFVEIVLKHYNDEREWMRWAPLHGTQPLL